MTATAAQTLQLPHRPTEGFQVTQRNLCSHNGRPVKNSFIRLSLSCLIAWWGDTTLEELFHTFAKLGISIIIIWCNGQRMYLVSLNLSFIPSIDSVSSHLMGVFIWLYFSVSDRMERLLHRFTAVCMKNMSLSTVFCLKTNALWGTKVATSFLSSF